MMGRESKGGSVFSWADEVEKEEEAAATARSGQAQLRQWQKPNPFGSARPREVVLQDKGIDSKKLDLHLQQPSPSLHEFHLNEKPQKQSNPQPATTVLNSKLPVRLRGSPTVTVSSHPQFILTPQIRSPTLLVPPLKYPPKYVAGFLYEHWVSTAPNASGYQHFKLKKENRSPGGGKSESTMCGTGNTRRRRRTTNGLVEAKEAQQKGIILEREENFNGSNSLGLPLMNQNIGTPEMHNKRMSLSANGIGRQPRNIQDSVMDENNEAMEHKWQKVTKKRHDFRRASK